MQVNVYIPKSKQHLLSALTEEAERTGRSKNELILEAIEQHVAPSAVPEYRTYPLGARTTHRDELYRERLG